MDPAILETNRRKMSKISMYLGIASLGASIVLLTIPYISIGLASFAILLAILSRGRNTAWDKNARIGFASAIPAVMISVGILVTVVVALYTNTTYRKNVGQLMDQIYGSEFEEAYHQSASDVLDQLLGK